jgi:hypothetical protein
MNDLGHARTGTSAVGRPRARALPSGDQCGRAAAAPKFGVVDVIAQHDEQAHEELAGDGDPGLRAPAAMAQREVGAFEISVEPRGVGGRLAEDPAEQRAALFGDMAEAILVGGGLEAGSQAYIAHDVLGIGEARDRPQDDHGGERRQWADAGMREQAWGVRMGERGGGNGRIELLDLSAKGLEQFEAVVASLRGIGRQWQRLQLGHPGAPQKLGTAHQALIERDRVQPVLEHGLDPDEAPTVREQGAQVPRGRIGHPDGREPIVPEQVQEVPSVPLIGLRLADDHGANLGGIADEHGVPETVHEGMEPDGVASAFNADGDWTGQGCVEFLDGASLVNQLPLMGFARLGVECRNLLLARGGDHSQRVS